MDKPFIGESLKAVADWCNRTVQRTDCFIDVGANDGMLSAYVADNCFPRTLIAIEGNPYIFKNMDRQISKYILPSTEYYSINKLCLDNSEEKNFYCPEMSPSQSSIFDRFTKNKESVLNVKVKATTIDEIVKELFINVPIVVKMDIELSEPLAWKGMKRSMPIIRDICMEFMPSSLNQDAGINPSDFLKEIFEDGFEVLSLTGASLDFNELLSEPSKIDIWLRNKNYGYI